MMKKIALMILLSCLLLSSMIAVEVTIGHAQTTNSYWEGPTPYWGYWKNGRNQYLIKVSELLIEGAGAGPINSVAFNVAELNSVHAQPDYQIKIGHTNLNELGSTFVPNLTQVYYNQSYEPVEGWNYHVFDTPFYWNGNSNIVIETVSSLNSFITENASVYYTSTAPANSSVYFFSDLVNAETQLEGFLSSQRANMKLEMTEGIIDIPYVATLNYPIDEAIWIPQKPTLNWNSGGGQPTGFKLYFGTEEDPPFLADLEEATEWTAPSALENGQTYYWRIVPYNDNGDAVNCPTWSFTTVPDEYIAIGQGLVEQRHPFGVYFGYERSAAIYSSEDMNSSGVLDQLSWYCSTSSDAEVPYKIYAKNYASDEFTAQSWNSFVSDATLLHEGSHVFSETGWHSIDLTIPFLYNGLDNLVIAVETFYGGFGTHNHPLFLRSLSTPNTHMRWSADHNPPTTNGLLDNQLPHIVMHMIPSVAAAPQPPILFSPLDGTEDLPIEGFDLSWGWDPEGGFPDYYEVYLADDPDEILTQNVFSPVNNSIFNPVTDGDFVLDYGQTWYWTVKAINDEGSAITMPPYSFQIEPDPVVTQFPWMEDFEGNYFPPPHWDMIDVDGDSNNWFPYTVDGSAHSGTVSAASASWLSGQGLTPDNWLITPPIEIPDDATSYMLEWWVAAQDPEWPSDHYGLYISTTNTSLDSFNLLYEETLSTTTWLYRYIDLSAYSGERIYLAFRHFNSSDMFFLKIDDIGIRETPAAPIFTINPEDWDFGEVEKLNTATKQFTITNNGGGTLYLNASNIHLSDNTENSFSLDAADLPVSLGIGETFEFTISLTPFTTGLKTVNLNIEDNLNRELHSYLISGLGVEETLTRVVNLNAVVSGGEDVILDWQAFYGNPGNPSWMHWDTGQGANNIGTGNPVNFDVAIKVTPDEYGAYSGMQISKVKFWPNEPTADYTLKIWTGTDDILIPDNLVYSQDITSTLTNSAWNEITLDTPVTIDGSSAYYVGYSVQTTTGYPAGCDSGPQVPNRGGLIKWDGVWSNLTDLVDDLDYNWKIRAYLEHPARDTAIAFRPRLMRPIKEQVPKYSKLERSSNLPQNFAGEPDRGLLGFMVLRDGDIISPDFFTEYHYVDENVAYGTYLYQIQAIHYTDITYSNELEVLVDPFPALEIPFNEDWRDASFIPNNWDPSGENWVFGIDGNPPPGVSFSSSPQLTDYQETLSSFDIDGTGFDELEVVFDLALDNYSPLYENALSLEVMDADTGSWHQVLTISTDDNDGEDFPFSTYITDISQYASDRIFRIRFVASGQNSFYLNYWHIDNIIVREIVPEELIAPTDLTANVDQNNVELSWTAPEISTRDFLGYRIYRDEEFIAYQDGIQTTSYTDSDLPNATYLYGVTAAYSSGESLPVTLEVIVDYDPDTVVFTDSFESYDDFSIDLAPWMTLDMDGSDTWGIANHWFPGTNDPMAFIAFNPNSTIPPYTLASAYDGIKMAASFSAMTPPNDDWLITPALVLGSESNLSFWAKSQNDEYGLERFRVGITASGAANPGEFDLLSGDDYLEAPTEWTSYSYDLADYDNQNVFIAIQCISDDAFMFFVDDFKVISEGGTFNEDPFLAAPTNQLQGNYPNPFNPDTIIKYSLKEPTRLKLSIFNLKGQLVKHLVDANHTAGEHHVSWDGTDANGHPVSSGIYFYQMKTPNFSSSRKMILSK